MILIQFVNFTKEKLRNALFLLNNVTHMFYLEIEYRSQDFSAHSPNDMLLGDYYEILSSYRPVIRTLILNNINVSGTTNDEVLQNFIIQGLLFCLPIYLSNLYPSLSFSSDTSNISV